MAGTLARPLAFARDDRGGGMTEEEDTDMGDSMIAGTDQEVMP